MWTDTTRTQYARAELALPSDLTDAEWAVLEPFFPPPSHVGRPRKWPLRRIVEAILYLLRGEGIEGGGHIADGPPFVGYCLSLPRDPNATAVEYTVNNVYDQQQLFNE